VLQCNCGFVARAVGEDDLVTEVQRHAREAHRMALTHDEALVLVFRAGLTAVPTTPRPVPAPTEKEER